MPFIKPPWAKVTMDGFIDFLRRYWLHIGIVLTIYNAKDFLDEVDRILMANTDGMLNMTPWIYAIEGEMALWGSRDLQSRLVDGFHDSLLCCGIHGNMLCFNILLCLLR